MDIAALGTSPNADELVSSIDKFGLHKHIVDLDAYGFTVIPPETLGVKPESTERLREAVLRTYEERTGASVRGDQPSTKSGYPDAAWMLLQEDEAFVDAILHPIHLTIARWLLGQSAVLSATTCIVKPPFEHLLPLHTDTIGVPAPTSSFAHVCNLSWLLTDYEDTADGPTVFVPGSHRFGRRPFPHERMNFLENDAPHRTVPLLAPAGSLAIWHGDTWHGSLPRTNPGLRVTFLSYWCRVYMKPINPWPDVIGPELIERHPELTRVLGMEHVLPYREVNEHPDWLVAFQAAGADQFA
jgi:hypothetical protein